MARLTNAGRASRSSSGYAQANIHSLWIRLFSCCISVAYVDCPFHYLTDGSPSGGTPMCCHPSTSADPMSVWPKSSPLNNSGLSAWRASA